LHGHLSRRQPEFVYLLGYSIKLLQNRIISQEYIRGFSLVIKNEYCRSVFEFGLHLNEPGFQGSLNRAIVSSASGDEFFDDSPKSFSAELVDWNNG